ncbi:BnaC03g44080D [Brassica napus]|uniref:BnaC03g44080D protein n=1 Tax=Brassica napus TaxID=3708 RepID=A0A078FQC4_BRANA|nr:BnaC03g44080D [Brassica napus]
MTKMSNLPRDLAEEVLSKVPLTSLRKVRSTCKEWKTLSKRRSFVKKHLGQASVGAASHKVVMMMDLRIYLMSINLNNKNDESCIKHEGKLISGSDEVDISRVFHCDGLLLFIPKGSTCVVVCNPYSGQTRFIESTFAFRNWWNYSYALGYEKSSSRKHKVLRFITVTDFVECKIYDLSSDSWRERFGPPLPLPFEPFDEDTVSLSSVREEQLAVLFQRWDSLELEIWVTTKIEPESVTWNTKVFLQVNMSLQFQFQFLLTAASFFIDEEKKVAVVFDKNKERSLVNRNVAYIIGVDESLREADLGDSNDKNCYPLACSYVPSLAKLT